MNFTFATVHRSTRGSSWRFEKCPPWRYFDYAKIMPDSRELRAEQKVYITGINDMRGNTVCQIFSRGTISVWQPETISDATIKLKPK